MSWRRECGIQIPHDVTAASFTVNEVVLVQIQVGEFL
jgi:hypothetical protein